MVELIDKRKYINQRKNKKQDEKNSNSNTRIDFEVKNQAKS